MTHHEREAAGSAPPEAPTYTLGQLVMYFLKLGAIGFGGPVALTGYMQRDLVDRRAWVTQAQYKDGLLKLTLPRAATARPRRVTVQTEG